MIKKLINKLHINTVDIGSQGKSFLFVENLDQKTGFKLDEKTKLPFIIILLKQFIVVIVLSIYLKIRL
jgi:hypothetical protein